MLKALPTVAYEDDPTQRTAIPFFSNNHNFDGRANGKRGGARAFNEGNAAELAADSAEWEKRGGGRSFTELEVNEAEK